MEISSPLMSLFSVSFSRNACNQRLFLGTGEKSRCVEVMAQWPLLSPRSNLLFLFFFLLTLPFSSIFVLFTFPYVSSSLSVSYHLSFVIIHLWLSPFLVIYFILSTTCYCMSSFLHFSSFATYHSFLSNSPSHPLIPTSPSLIHLCYHSSYYPSFLLCPVLIHPSSTSPTTSLCVSSTSYHSYYPSSPIPFSCVDYAVSFSLSSFLAIEGDSSRANHWGEATQAKPMLPNIEDRKSS